MVGDTFDTNFRTFGETRQPQVSQSQLAELPSELIEQVAGFLGQPDLLRLGSTSKTMRANVLGTPHESLVEPSRRERVLGARIKRQNQARANMAKGLCEHYSWQLSGPLQSKVDPRQLFEWGQDGSIPHAIVTHRAGVDVLTAPEARSSAGLGVPGPHRFFDSMPLVPNHSRHAVVVEDSRQGLGVWHVGEGLQPVFYKFAEMDSFAHSNGNAYRLGSEGTTLTSDLFNRTKQFWQLIDGRFEPRGPGSLVAADIGAYPHDLSICPKTGRIALIKGRSLLCYSRDLTLCGQIRAKANFGTTLNFSPDGKILMLKSRKTSPSFPTKHYFSAAYSVSGALDEAPVLRLHFNLAKNSRIPNAWHLDRQGHWHLKLHDCDGYSKSTLIHLMPLSTPERGLRRTATQIEAKSLYLEALSQSYTIDIVGHDENANRYHILGKDAQGCCWLYRITAHGETVARTAFAAYLAAQIAANEMGQILWAHDATSMQITVSGGYRYLDFSPAGLTPETLSSRYGTPIKNDLKELTEMLAYMWQTPVLRAVCIGLILGGLGVDLYRGGTPTQIAMALVPQLGLPAMAIAVAVSVQSIFQARTARDSVFAAPISTRFLEHKN